MSVYQIAHTHCHMCCGLTIYLDEFIKKSVCLNLFRCYLNGIQSGALTTFFSTLHLLQQLLNAFNANFYGN